MTVRVLGPMDTGGRRLSPRERAVLSALIVRRDSAVSPSELADAWWGAAPPATWAQQIRNAVARIRAALGPDSVRTVGVDYRLGLDPDAVDVVQFERSVSDARRHALQGEHDRAAAAYGRALELWRGEPYPDLASWQPGGIEALRLHEIRANAQEELLDARLRCGEHRSVIPDAERLVREDPLREHRWAILALANYRADRQAEAMAVLRSARLRLSEDLGIDPSRALLELERGILQHDPSLDVPVDVSRDLAEAACPYRGLAPFQPEDRALFFGRDADIAAVRERCDPGEAVSVIGASGSGKSSLVRAGVVPALRDLGRTVTLITPDARLGERVAGAVGAGVAVICLDQAEELLALSPVERDQCATALAAFVSSGGSLLLTLRSDFIDPFTALPALGPLIGRGLYALAPLDEAGLRQAVTAPAAAAGLRLEAGLVEVIMRDAGARPGILPALSHTLAATWARREGSTLTVDAYEAAGGIAGAIAQSAERVYQDLDAAGQAVCRSLMMRLVERTAEAATIRRRVALEALSTDPQRLRVIEDLVAARLVIIDGDAATIAHEAVGTTWPRLEQWLTEDAADARMLRRIEAAAAAWESAGRPDDELMRGGLLHGASEWRDAAHPELTDAEAAFLDASIARHTAELRELEARSRRERSINRRLRLALGAGALLLVAAVVAGSVAAVRGREAVASAEDARIEALAATSLSIRDSDRDIAGLLAVELHNRWPEDSRARSALLGSLQAAGGLGTRIVLDEDSRLNGALIPGTRTVLMVADSASATADPGSAAPPARVWIADIDSGATVRDLDVSVAPVNHRFERDVYVSADGSTAFIQSGGMRDPDDPRTCCLNYLDAIDIASGTANFPTVVFDDRTGQKPVLTDDGTRAYFIHSVTGDPGWIDLQSGRITLSTPHDPEEFEGVGLRLNGVALVDGLLYVGDDAGLIMYEAESLERVGVIALPEPGLADILLVPDPRGGIVATGHAGSVRVDLETGDVVWRRSTDELWCVDATALADTILCVTTIGPIREFSLADGLPTGRSFRTLSDWNRGIQVLPGATELVTFTSRSPAAMQRWRLDAMPGLTRTVAAGHVATGGLGDDGRLLIVADAPDGPAAEYGDERLWDIVADAPVGEPAPALVWVSDAVVARLTDAGFVLEDVTTGQRRRLDVGQDDQPLWPISGGRGPHAFAALHDRLVAFDPATGAPYGVAIPLPFDGLDTWMRVSELADTDRVALTWWDDDAQRTVTTVFSISTGEALARGLEDDVATVGLPSGDLLSASASRLVQTAADLTPLRTLAKPGAAPDLMEVSDDGSLLLVSTFSHGVSLYDLDDARRLGDEVTSTWILESIPSGALSPDGTSMVTTGSDGVLVWDLDPEVMRAAVCAMVGREPTDIEWSTYFSDADSRQPVCAR